MSAYILEPIGFIRSTVKGREDAPRQGSEGAPDAWLEIEPPFADALLGIEVGHELIVITWLHEAKRDVLKTSAERSEPSAHGCVLYPFTGAAESLGLHPVTVREIDPPSRDRHCRQNADEDRADRGVRRHTGCRY